MNMAARLRQAIREKRRFGLFVLAAQACEKYLHAWYNEGHWDMPTNGEAWALNRFATWSGDRPVIVWDVGSNCGDWAVEAHAALPSAIVTGFELVEPVFAGLASRLAAEPWFTAVCMGLSDKAGEAIVEWNRSQDRTSALDPRLEHPLFRQSESVRAPCMLTTGDLYAAAHAPPDLLKIDTEGHDAKVLKGCRGFLESPHGPSMIQFEYGDTFIPSGDTLKEIYDLLSPAGYRIGRLFPNHVAFKAYEYRDDHFRMGNYIAVRSAELEAMLS